jgi:hypothetical protein
MPARVGAIRWLGHPARLERFRAKWIPVRVKKTRQDKNPEPRSDSIGTEMALVAALMVAVPVFVFSAASTVLQLGKAIMKRCAD